LKLHAQTGITCSLKLSMGICERKERLKGHDYRLDEKIVDLSKAGWPNFIIVDGVDIGIGGAGTPYPYHLGILIMGKNPVAVDSIASRILSLEPQEVPHLLVAYRRGYGPIDLKDIEIRGDISLRKAKERGMGLRRIKIETENPMIQVFLGKLPYGDKCIGGCVGFLKEALFFIKSFRDRREDKRIDKIIRWIVGSGKKRRIGIVLGKYSGEIPEDIEQVLLMGDCAEVSHKGKRVRGCPVYMGRQVWWISKLSGLPNPWLDRKEAFPFLKNLVISRINSLIR